MVLRTVLKPRWLALLALVVAVIWLFTLLGLWQLDVARSSAAEDAARDRTSRPVVALDEVAHPHEPLTAEAVGSTVHAAGVYDPDGEVLLTGRRLGDRTGYWVATPLVVTGTGAVIPVVRGFVSDPEAARPVPSGQVQVTGMLAPGESPPDERVPLPAGQLQKLDLSVLVNQRTEAMYTGFVFLTEQSPPPANGAVTMFPPPSLGTDGIAWRNLAYAVQWWLFAAFAVYMWWRMVREDHRRSHGHRDPPASPGGPPSPEPAGPVPSTSLRPTVATSTPVKGNRP